MAVGGFYKRSVVEKESVEKGSAEKEEYLAIKANTLRREALEITTSAGSGHPTSCLSCAEIMSCLFFSELKKGDEFILSKGHAAPILWTCLAEAGLVERKELLNLRKFDSVLEGHPTPLTPGVKVATGSLGQGLSAGVGMALALRLEKKENRVYVLLGDGECAEGSVWEAVNAAAFYKLENLCAIVDVNRLGQSRETMHGWNLDAYRKKFEAFGWQAAEVDGHHVHDLLDVFEEARKSKGPFVILAKTVKGKGVSSLENKEGWHGKSLSKEEIARALKELSGGDVILKSNFEVTPVLRPRLIDVEMSNYQMDEMVSTREAFGKALVELGKRNKQVVVLDGDVKNSTKTENFFKEFPEQSFDCFIAEQNMAGMALGFSSRGFVPFTATFSAFLSRAHDFIRMALYSKANIKFVGSHAGVSVGEDGPSQMGLEDLSMFLSLPGPVILYPSDAVSTAYLVGEMAKHYGISYLRTARGKTPVIYKKGEKFPVGGLKVLRKSGKDKVLIVAAGITVHEALKAYDLLQKGKKKIPSRVIDLYSVQPIDGKALLKNARECGNNVLVVEDHYFNGIGSVVSKILLESGKEYTYGHLFIKEIPRSGKSEELLRMYGIDAGAIVEEVRRMLKD